MVGCYSAVGAVETAEPAMMPAAVELMLCLAALKKGSNVGRSVR